VLYGPRDRLRLSPRMSGGWFVPRLNEESWVLLMTTWRAAATTCIFSQKSTRRLVPAAPTSTVQWEQPVTRTYAAGTMR